MSEPVVTRLREIRRLNNINEILEHVGYRNGFSKREQKAFVLSWSEHVKGLLHG